MAGQDCWKVVKIISILFTNWWSDRRKPQGIVSKMRNAGKEEEGNNNSALATQAKIISWADYMAEAGHPKEYRAEEPHLAYHHLLRQAYQQ